MAQSSLPSHGDFLRLWCFSTLGPHPSLLPRHFPSLRSSKASRRFAKVQRLENLPKPRVMKSHVPGEMWGALGERVKGFDTVERSVLGVS